jgi:hypothetical protein
MRQTELVHRPLRARPQVYPLVAEQLLDPGHPPQYPIPPPPIDRCTHLSFPRLGHDTEAAARLPQALNN